MGIFFTFLTAGFIGLGLFFWTFHCSFACEDGLANKLEQFFGKGKREKFWCIISCFFFVVGLGCSVGWAGACGLGAIKNGAEYDNFKRTYVTYEAIIENSPDAYDILQEEIDKYNNHVKKNNDRVDNAWYGWLYNPRLKALELIERPVQAEEE